MPVVDLSRFAAPQYGNPPPAASTEEDPLIAGINRILRDGTYHADRAYATGALATLRVLSATLAERDGTLHTLPAADLSASLAVLARLLSPAVERPPRKG